MSTYRIRCDKELTVGMIDTVSKSLWCKIKDDCIYVCSDSKLDGESFVVPVSRSLSKSIYPHLGLPYGKTRKWLEKYGIKSTELLTGLRYELASPILDHYGRNPDQLSHALARSPNQPPWKIRRSDVSDDALVVFEEYVPDE